MQAWPLLMNYLVVTGWILYFIFTFRNRISCMAAMIAAMASGMGIGLGIGTLLTVWFPGHLFQVTVLAMMIGAVVGVLAGFSISIMAVLDGLLSGLMGGMMGVMLMTMLPTAYATAALKITGVFCSGALFILFLMLQGEIKPVHLKEKSALLSKPQPLFIVIAVFLLLSQQSSLHPPQTHTSLQAMPEMNMSMRKGSSSSHIPQLVPVASRQIVVRAEDFSFSPNLFTLSTEESVRLILENEGKIEHDFEIVGTDVHVHAQPGSTESITFSLKKPGQYTAVCTLPGHREAGMISVVKVHSPSS